MSDVVDQAIKTVNGERQKDYGSPYDDFTRVSGALSSLGFCFREPNGNIRTLEAKDIPIVMVMVKLSREVNHHKDENIIDGIGYFKCLDQVHVRQKELYEQPYPAQAEEIEISKIVHED